MNINTERFRYQNLFGHSRSVGKIFKGKVVSTTRFADTEPSAKDEAYSASISEDSKTMLQRWQEEQKRSEEKKKNEEQKLADEKKQRAAETDSSNYILLEGVHNVGISDAGRLYQAAHRHDGDPETGYYTFTGLSVEYAEMREECIAQYTGEELKEKLDALFASFEEAVEMIADGVDKAIRSAAARGGEKAVRDTIDNLFGKSVGTQLQRMLGIMGVGANKPFLNSLDEITSILKGFVNDMAHLWRNRTT